jgi:hypothetical protein
MNQSPPSSGTAPVANPVMSAHAKRVYVQALIEHLESDKRHSLYLITFGVGCIAFTLDKVVFSQVHTLLLDEHGRRLLGFSLASVALGTALNAVWLALLHLLRIRALDLLVTLDVEHARTVHYPGERFAKRWGWIGGGGIALLCAGIAGYAAVVFSRLM